MTPPDQNSWQSSGHNSRQDVWHNVWPWTLVGLALGAAVAAVFAMLGGGSPEHAEGVSKVSAACTFPVSMVAWGMVRVTSANWLVPVAGSWIVHHALVGTIAGAVVAWRRAHVRSGAVLLALLCTALPFVSLALTRMLW